jgi:hypothetical protein
MLTLGFGVALILSSGAQPNAQATCNGQVMSPGDVCYQTQNGSTTGSSSYGQELTSARKAHPAYVVFGAILALVGVFFLTTGVRQERARRRTGGVGPAPAVKTFNVSCPHCSTNLVSPAGQNIRCPKCNGVLNVTPRAT